MKRLLTTFLAGMVVISVVVQAISQPRPAAVAQLPAADTLERALLWKIEGDSAIGTSYIFGTIHLIDSEQFFLPEGTEAALEQSDRIVFEIDMADMMDLGAQLSLFAKAFMKGGVTLRDLVSDEDYQIVKAHFEEMGLPLFMLERIKPMFLSVFATGDFSAADLQGGGTTSYEMEFYQRALDNEKTTGGLETMEFQISVFDSIPYEEQAKMLVESIKFEDEGTEQFDRMMQLYLDQDVDGLYAITSAEGELGDYEGLLLDDRNANWIAVMKELMSHERVFFAVGAAHLGGEGGVIRLLRNAGFVVTPVMTDIDIRPVKRF